MGRPKEAIEILEECVADVPGDVFARSVLGGTYRQIGEYEKALEHFAQAVEKEPNDETLRLSIAGIYLSQQKVAEAAKLVDQALEIEPECAQAYFMRGRILATQGKDEETLALCRKAI